MPLITCKACNSRISSEAFRCPTCGSAGKGWDRRGCLPPAAIKQALSFCLVMALLACAFFIGTIAIANK